jgi:hypothetical protein
MNQPLSKTLNELIGFTEEVITRPNRYSGHALDARFAPIAASVRHADALPAESVRTTRAGVVVVTVLEAFFAGDREPHSQLLGLAGAALPWLRAEAFRALRNEQEARGQS